MMEPYIHSPIRRYGTGRTLLATLCVYVGGIQERVFVLKRRVDILKFNLCKLVLRSPFA
jgi:hypothetical protein